MLAAFFTLFGLFAFAGLPVGIEGRITADIEEKEDRRVIDGESYRVQAGKVTLGLDLQERDDLAGLLWNLRHRPIFVGGLLVATEAGWRLKVLEARVDFQKSPLPKDD